MKHSPTVFGSLVHDTCLIDRRRRQRFHKIGHAEGIPLACRRRATQFAWLIHATVLAQKQPQVRIPARTFAQLVWGAATPPKNWRSVVRATLRSMCEPIRKAAPLLAEFKMAGRDCLITISTQAGDGEKPGQTDHHSFLGELQHRHVANADGAGAYLFTHTPEEKAAKRARLKACRKAKKDGEPLPKRPASFVVPASLLVGMFGPARWSGLDEGEQRILQGLLRETTLTKGQPMILQDNLVPNASGRQQVACPLLPARGGMVPLAGQYGGRGYSLCGKGRGRGWWYLFDEPGVRDPNDWREITRRLKLLVRRLRRVVELLDGVVVGLSPGDNRWHGIDAIEKMTRSARGIEQLVTLLVRVYVSADFRTRLRNHFVKQGGFSAIPNVGDVEASPDEGTDKTESIGRPSEAETLRIRIKESGLSQAALAQRLGVSQPFLNRTLNGKRPLPAELRSKVEAALAVATAAKRAS